MSYLDKAITIYKSKFFFINKILLKEYFGINISRINISNHLQNILYKTSHTSIISSKHYRHHIFMSWFNVLISINVSVIKAITLNSLETEHSTNLWTLEGKKKNWKTKNKEERARREEREIPIWFTTLDSGN